MRRKLNAMPAVFAGKRVLLVDDSIVRGTTMSQIVDMVRRAGASKVRAPVVALLGMLGVGGDTSAHFVCVLEADSFAHVSCVCMYLLHTPVLNPQTSLFVRGCGACA